MKLPTVPGLEIALSVDGQDLHEYDDEADANGAEYTRYVEAVPGANFAIQFRPDRRFQYSHNTLELKVYLDGVSTQGKVYSPKARTGGHTAHTVTGKTEQIGGRGFRRKFAFADLKTTDDKPPPEMKEKLANLGEVTVKIFRVRETGHTPRHDRIFQEVVGASGIPEKALKGRAISSLATLGEAEPAKAHRGIKVVYPWGRDPFAVYKFKYRTRTDLQIEDIIPRSPSPVPLEERDPDTLSAEEARQLVRIQRQKLQDQVKIKKEKRERDDEGQGGDDDDGEVTVMEERKKRPRLSNDSGVEVIDLSNETEDEDD